MMVEILNNDRALSDRFTTGPTINFHALLTGISAAFKSPVLEITARAVVVF